MTVEPRENIPAAPAPKPAESKKPAQEVARVKSARKDGRRSEPRARRFRDVYRLGKTLGTGGFAVVRLGQEKETMQEWAIKIMALPTGDTKQDKAARSDIYKEISILSQVHHPNVLFLKEYYEENSKVFIVTELIKGGELLQAVSELGNYSEVDARQVFKQLMSGLDYLHERGIVHRDLKLENLLLSTPGNITEGVKIVDFGLAKKAAEGAMNTICGTPMYVAPEVVNCNAGFMYHETVDLWSAGVILFILLSGYPPFHDENDAALFDKIRKGHFEFDDDVWNNVSDLAKELVRNLLVVDPKQRLSCKQTLAHAWFSADLQRKNLNAAQRRLKKMVKRKFKGAVEAVIAVNRMKHALLMFTGTERRGGAAADPDKPTAEADVTEEDDEMFGGHENVMHAVDDAAQYVRIKRMARGPEAEAGEGAGAPAAAGAGAAEQ